MSAQQVAETAGPDVKFAEQFVGKIAASVRRRETLLKDWKENVNFRAQKMFASESGQDRVAVPEDWARTKQKTAQLMFQVPKVVLTPKQPQYMAAAPVFQAVLNHKLHHEIKAEVMLDECLADVVNAAGLMVSMVGIDITTRDMEVPGIDVSTLSPQDQLLAMQSGAVKMIKTKQPIFDRYYWKRISPASFLWPAEFSGSNWDEAPWLGYEDWMPLELAKKTFDKLPPDFKSTSKPTLLSDDIQTDKPELSGDSVKVQVIYYKAYLLDPAAFHPEHIRRIVFVDGHDEPVVHEDCTWQTYVEAEATEAGEQIPGHYVGIRKFPIRVATLTYVSDLATPPSDSQAGRSQVRELVRSRSQMLRQRDRSIPIRWFDTNRLDNDVVTKIEAGDWQDLIPVNGPGERVIGEVARANYPRENFTFQNIIGADLDRAWSLSNNQLASESTNERSATEANLIQSAANIRLEYEKARVYRYVVEGSEVLAGLVQKFTDRTDYVQLKGPDGAKRMESWDREKVQGEFAFDIMPDSGNRLDPAVLQERLLKLYNLAANDPTINRPELMRQLVESYGFDPTVITKEPPPPQPEQPNISYRFSGEDMTNPVSVALMLKSNAITPDEIKAAVMLIKDAMSTMATMQPPPPQPPAGGAPPPGVEPEAVEPPETVSPILKRAVDGSRMV